MGDDFTTFLETVRRPAAEAFVAGDAGPVERLSAPAGQATFFDPGGGFTEGAEAINRANREGATQFGPNGTTELQVKDLGESGDLAFWTGFQKADLEAGGKPQSMRLRVTEVFRCEDGGWKMIHRHASAASDTEKGFGGKGTGRDAGKAQGSLAARGHAAQP